MWGSFARMSGAEIALDLAGTVARFEERSADAIVGAQSDIDSTIQLLEDRRRVWEEELQQRQAALDACLQTVTEDGPPDCSGYAAAREAASRTLDTVCSILRRVEAVASGFNSSAASFNRELASTCPQARAELHRLSGIIGWYEG